MAKRREANIFSLSFLDIMSCGFGAVILIYIVINHATEATTQEVSAQVMAEVTRLEELVTNEKENLIVLRNTVKEQDDEIVTTQDMAQKLVETIRSIEAVLAALQTEGASQDQTIDSLKSELKELELEAANLEGSVGADESTGTAL
ncbi:MAG: VWA domain-containing protein, partial [Gammaproteobacteria bacterium]|nr:VWA domain-containing protein [Gammaproteobacteria bacterium]